MMASLYPLFAILSVAISLANAQDLSSLQLNRNFQVNLPVTKLKVLNAFKRANPQLPAALSNGGLFVSVWYEHDNRAIIDVSPGTRPYSGFVEVYYNGGRPYTPSGSPINYGPGKLNLSILSGLTVRLNVQGTVTNDSKGHKKLINAFMDANQLLPNELRLKLKVKKLKSTNAFLYVVPSADYEGDVFVSF